MVTKIWFLYTSTTRSYSERRDAGMDVGFVKRGGGVSTFGKRGGRVADMAQNGLNLHNFTVKRGAGAGTTHAWICLRVVADGFLMRK